MVLHIERAWEDVDIGVGFLISSPNCLMARASRWYLMNDLETILLILDQQAENDECGRKEE